MKGPRERIEAVLAGNGAVPTKTEGLARAIRNVLVLADKMRAESPKPGPGGFLAEEIECALLSGLGLDHAECSCHTRAEPDKNGDPVPVQCGPVYLVTDDEEARDED